MIIYSRISVNSLKVVAAHRSTTVCTFFEPFETFFPINLRHHVKVQLLYKSNLLLDWLYYAEAFNEFAMPISASLRLGNTDSFGEMSLRREAVGNTVSDLTGLRFEAQTSRSRNKGIMVEPTGWLYN